jgi:PAS domain S-box-containing protein
VSASRQTTFQRGAGLPGTAWARREPVWLDDVSGQLNFPRLAYAVRAGWQSAVAFAIRGGGEVFAVMEFFSVEPRPADEELIHVVGTMSNQIDQFVERWQAEGAVRAGELRTRAILEAALDCIVTMDHVGRVVEWNPAAERTFGWGRGEALGQEMAELIIPLSLRDAHRQGLARYLASGEGAVIGKRIELVAMRRDGSEFPVELAITPIPAEGPPLFTGFIRDITERKRVEAAERDARAEAEASTRMLQRVQTIADVALAHYALDDLLRELLSRVCEILAGDTAVILLLDPDGRELHVRAALGLEEELATAVTIPVGRGVAGRIAAQGAPLIVQDLSTVEVIMPALRSAGIRSLVGAPLHVEGRVIGVIHVGVRQPHQYTDEDARLLQMVADRAALAIDHARLYQEAQEGVRLRDEFLSIASHELKTPITSLLAYTQLLARRLDQQRGVSERDRRAVQVIGEQAERLARLIAALLDLSRIETGHFPIERRRMDLVRLLGRIVDEVRPTLKQHTLAFDSAVKALQIDGDELRLEQVFRNLLQNAIKYSPSGGPIGVHIEPRDDRAAIYVRDQGVGIPEAARERLFHRFFRASNIAGSNISGFGIGLYIVCEIVSRHGGTVEVMSEEGKGSTFVVRLPLRGPAENT